MKGRKSRAERDVRERRRDVGEDGLSDGMSRSGECSSRMEVCAERIVEQGCWCWKS